MALALGIIGLFTALVTNLDRVADLWRSVTGTSVASEIEGNWMAILREYSPDDPLGGETISKELIKLNTRGSNIWGDDHNEDNSRTWNVSGFYKNSILVLNYVDQNAASKSIGSYVLEANPNGKTFKGYWLGYDRDLGKLVACAYIMTKENANMVKDLHKEFLGRPCYKWPPPG